MKISIEAFRNLGFGIGLLGGSQVWIEVFGSVGFVGIIACSLAGGAIGHILGTVILGLMKPAKVTRNPRSASHSNIKSERPEDRIAAAVKLGDSGSARAIISLITALSDENSQVRDSAHASLIKLTGQDFQLDSAAWKVWWDESKRR